MGSRPKDIVLDFHVGSGTTSAVAHKTGRQYIGIEQMDYVENITIERMKKVIGKQENGLEKQKKLLAELLNKNQLYVNLSEIDDEDFHVSNEDKKLNREFYGEGY